MSSWFFKVQKPRIIYDCTLILYLGNVPGLVSLFILWLRKAWRILVVKDYSQVAAKLGKSPENPQKYALTAGLINLLGGGIFLAVILLIIFTGLMHYDSWTAIVGVTLWMKILADFALSRFAHMQRGK